MNSCSSNPNYLNKSSEEALEIPATEEPILESPNQLEYEFERDEVSPLGLEAFENRAIQKVKDFGDYIAIISDTSINSEFINQAKLMLLSMFKENSRIVIISNSNKDITNQIKLKDFIDIVEQNHSTAYTLKFENISISNALSERDNNSYIGQVKCTLKTFSQLLINQIPFPSSSYKAEIKITVKKIPKDFGSTTREIWEVLLGDITLTMVK